MCLLRCMEDWIPLDVLVQTPSLLLQHVDNKGCIKRLIENFFIYLQFRHQDIKVCT